MMGLLVGLPLKIFYMLFAVLRFAWPILLGLLIYAILRKLRQRAGRTQRPGRPDVEGPVVEVDYEVVDEEE